MDNLVIRTKLEALPLLETVSDILVSDRFDYAFKHAAWEKLKAKFFDGHLSVVESAYLCLFDLLYTLEGPFSFVMNSVICALITEGHHDIWSELKQRFVSSFSDVLEIPLSTRLKFLNSHGFEFFSEICPRKIRNAIAHQNFKIEPDGSIAYDGKEMSLSELRRITDRMVTVVKLFVDSL